MSMTPLVSMRIETEADVVAVRQRTWQLAEALGFEKVERTRLSTAVSEIARNALTYAKGGEAAFLVAGRSEPQRLVVRIIDHGPGIAVLDEVMEGRYRSRTGMGLGMIGAKRLVDAFHVRTVPGHGATVEIGQGLPAGRIWSPPDLAALVRRLPEAVSTESHQILRQQNVELMETLDRLRRREEESERLRQELEDTNRGVVALYAELDAKADQLREASEMKSRFLSNISHEFRTPLNSILALCGLLHERVDGDLSPEQERQVTYIRRSADDLLMLVNDLLDIAKVESGRVDLHVDAFTVDDLFSALRGALRPLQQSADVELVFEAAPHLPQLHTDEHKLAQIVRNLIANALKFTLKGHVRVEAGLQPDGLLRIAVIDSGTGIAPEHLDHIFEEFAQVGSALNKHVRGTGLGLPLSRRLAGLLGGSISVESEFGKGSVFTLVIPFDLPGTKIEGGKPTILIADDDETFRYVLSQSIRSMGGFDVLEASGGDQALRILQDHKTDVLLLDLQMPDRSGLSVLDKISQDPALASLPVIVTSSTLVPDDDQPPGLQDVLMLPKQSLSRDLLSRLLTEALKRNPSHA